MMKRSRATLPSPYYPPRAGWGTSFSRPTQAWWRKFQALNRRLPAPAAVAQDALCILMPGMSFYLAGWRKLGKCIFAGCVIALLVFLAELGRPAANWAFMLLLSAHTASVSQRFQPRMAERPLMAQMGFGLIIFTAISVMFYLPARELFQQHVATPLPTARGLLVLNARTRPASVERGDLLAYRIEGSYANSVQVRDGYGFGPVLAIPGDHVTFEENLWRVNGVVRARLAHMPRTGELVISQKQWLVWPEVGVTMHGMSEDVTAQGMLKLALVNQDQVVGKPFKRWFFRKQI